MYVRHGHSVCSIKHCIQDLLGHGWNISSSLEDRRVRFEVSLWSDDFEASYSIKTQRLSVYIKTITIAPRSDINVPIVYTYPLAIGPKGIDHSLIEDEIVNEMVNLYSSGDIVYHGEKKGIISFNAKVGVSLQDQPMRRETLKLASGRSNFHARFGTSMNCKALQKFIPACGKCVRFLESCSNITPSMTSVTSVFENWTCNTCSCWCVRNDHIRLRHFPPKDYPTEILGEDLKIAPFQITTDQLIRAVDMAHEKILSQEWSSANAVAYLKTNCLDDASIDQIVANAQNCLVVKVAESQKEADPELYNSANYLRKQNPKLFSPWKKPSLWNELIPINVYAEVPMHLLFLGIVKTTISEVNTWLSKRQLMPGFLEFAAPVLHSVKELNLNWCKILPYSSGKFGGWVSENFLALSRLLRWFYSPIEKIPEAPEYEEPAKHYSTWTKSENLAWLRARGLTQHHKKNAKELRAIVEQEMNDPQGPTAVVGPTGGPVEAVTEVVNSLTNMINICMCECDEDDRIWFSNVYVRLFLSAFDRFENNLYPQRKVPGWISHYNFISLLNVPKVLEKYGSMRNIWEGGEKGEGFLKTVKSHIPNSYTKNWHVNLMTKLLKEKALYALTEEEMNKDREKGHKGHIYSSGTVLEERLLHRKPLSVTAGLNKILHVAFYKGRRNRDGTQTIMQRKVNIVHGGVNKINGMCYFQIELDDAAVELRSTEHIYNQGLLLPALSENGLPSLAQTAHYTVIFDNWTFCSNCDIIEAGPFSSTEPLFTFDEHKTSTVEPPLSSSPTPLL